MGKKSRAERQKAASRHAQRTGVQVTTADKLIVSDVQIAAAFLTSTDCCPKQAKIETGMQLGAILKIANGQAQPRAHHATIITTAAENLGWAVPVQAKG